MCFAFFTIFVMTASNVYATEGGGSAYASGTEYITVDAPSLEQALEQVGIKDNDSYEIVGDLSKDRSLKSAVPDDILFGR